jgi:Neuraminidase (sialidase)
MMRISRDETQTWSDPVTCIIDKKGYFVLNNDRVIQLSNGRLLMAVALHKTPDDVTWHNKAKLYSYYSDDNGQTWTSSEAVSSPAHIITQEPGVVELKNGNVMMFIRASSGSQYISYSEDKGETWSEARPGNIKSPLSPASIKRIPATGDLLLVWNNNDGSIPAIKDKRTPLHAAISDDDGKSWKLVTVIADDPDGWYCYIAIHFNKDHILLGYCAGSRRDNTHLSVVDITRLTTKSLYKK